MKKFLSLGLIVGFCLLLTAVVLIGLGPVLTIMSLNTLFGLSIAINAGAWFSCAWLLALLALFIRIFK